MEVRETGAWNVGASHTELSSRNTNYMIIHQTVSFKAIKHPNWGLKTSATPSISYSYDRENN